MVTADEPMTEEIQALNDPTVEFFILADYAEAVNGKLYLMGGGWDRVFVGDFTQPIPFSFAVGIQVPWNATNIRHTVQVTIEDLDRKKPVGFSMSAEFTTGRPPFIEQGETQRAMLAIPKVGALFPGPGAYQAVARLSTGHERRASFHLVQLPSVQVPQRPN